MAFDAPLEQERLQRLRDSFPYFARHCLFIRDKDGLLRPFVMNRAQRYLHDRIEEQLKRTGKVRAIVLKGRQMGISTYIEGRNFHKTWGGEGLTAYILTHEQGATDNLFGMAHRFQENVPLEFRHPTKASNAKELAFSDNDCAYAVATAGSKEAGRSRTIQLFHGSEVAFWPNADTHITSLVTTALADAVGTEGILESTANGVGNVFHGLWTAAVRGEDDFEPIFIPWWWEEKYVRNCPVDWEPSKEWREYGEAHDLEWPQLYWAFCKNRVMATSISEPEDKPCWKFMQEFPSTPEEAFNTSGNSFISGLLIAKARKPAETIPGVGPIIIGVDPARGGGDKTGVIDRCGRRMGQRICERWDESDTMVIVGRIVTLIKKFNPAMVNIDAGTFGAAIIDRLVELGYGHVVNAVNFGGSPLGIGPTGDELYANRRAEMWDNLRDWFQHPLGIQMPDDDVLASDLTSVIWGKGETHHNSANELVLSSKDKIRERMKFSPDLGDAAALTHAIPYQAAVVTAPRRDRVGRNPRTGY